MALIYTGIVFRLDHRSQTAGGRPVISQRGFVATRTGIAGLREQLHAEALRRGLGQAAGALVIADGAVWIWRLAADRFPQARQRLDFYHAVQPLAAVGWAVFGEDKARLKAWLQPLARQLKNQSAVKVIGQLEELQSGLPTGPASEAVAREVNYFHEHQERMDYRAGCRAREPIGSGAVSSGASAGMKRYCVWRCSGATTAGTCSSLIPSPATLQETEMRPIQTNRILNLTGPTCVAIL